MKAKLVSAVLGCTFAILVGIAITSVDWYAYGPAQAPDKNVEIGSGLARLETLRIANVNALETPVLLHWSQYVPITVTAHGADDTFEQNRKPSDLFGGKHNRATSSKRLRASIFVRIERKSSLGEGVACVSACGSGASIDSKQILSWSGKLGIPNVPGDYMGKVVLVYKEPGVTELDEVLIGTFPLKVVPGPQRGD